MSMEALELLKKRHSVRAFLNVELSKEIQDELKAEVTSINTQVAGLKFRLFFNNSDPFKGFFKSYGSFVNPSNYLAAVVDNGFDNIWEKAGYYAEQFVMKCVQLELGTCFVGGTYDPHSINILLKAGEQILFVVLFGIKSGYLRKKEKILVNFVHRKQYPISHFFEPSDHFEKECEKFPLLKRGTEAVAIAPSALNKRPTRIFISNLEDTPVICAKVDDKNKKNLIDLGIAKFNFNFATQTVCEWGNRSPLITSIDNFL